MKSNYYTPRIPRPAEQAVVGNGPNGRELAPGSARRLAAETPRRALSRAAWFSVDSPNWGLTRTPVRLEWGDFLQLPSSFFTRERRLCARDPPARRCAVCRARRLRARPLLGRGLRRPGRAARANGQSLRHSERSCRGDGCEEWGASRSRPRVGVGVARPCRRHDHRPGPLGARHPRWSRSMSRHQGSADHGRTLPGTGERDRTAPGARSRTAGRRTAAEPARAQGRSTTVSASRRWIRTTSIPDNGNDGRFGTGSTTSSGSCASRARSHRNSGSALRIASIGRPIGSGVTLDMSAGRSPERSAPSMRSSACSAVHPAPKSARPI